MVAGLSGSSHRHSVRAIVLALCVGLHAAGCTAASRIASAAVTQEGDLPCFAIPLDSETRAAPVRLQALSVTYGERTDWRQLPPTAWSWRISGAGTWVDVARARCMRYGDPPPLSEIDTPAQPLVAWRIYRVNINARPRDGDSPTLGYEAAFCIKPGDSSRPSRVVVVPWDTAASRWREEVCRAP